MPKLKSESNLETVGDDKTLSQNIPQPTKNSVEQENVLKKTPNGIHADVIEISPFKRVLEDLKEAKKNLNLTEKIIENSFTTMSNDGQNIEIEKSKKNKQIDFYEICSEIFQSKNLTIFTYLIPFLNSNHPRFQVFDKSMPFFTSLENLSNEASKHSSLRCKVIAKLYNYSIYGPCPQFNSVFVNCKKCNYINFTPFHFANIHQSNHLKLIQSDLKTSQYSTMMDSQIPDSQLTQHDWNEKSKENIVKNFSIEWLCRALPSGICSLPGSSQSENSVPIMSYQCPRCLLMNQYEEVSSQADIDYLEYIYRFWFSLRDGTHILNPCLFEDEIANLFLGSISAIEFYTNKQKTSQVLQNINKNFQKKFLFTIDCYKMNNSSPRSILKSNKVDMFYKVIGFEEIVEPKNVI